MLENYVERELKETNFRGANLENTLFWGSDLRWVDFSNCNLTNARIIACDIRHTIFKDAITNGLRLDGSVYNSEDSTGDETALKEWDKRVEKTLLQSKKTFPLEAQRAERSRKEI